MPSEHIGARFVPPSEPLAAAAAVAAAVDVTSFVFIRFSVYFIDVVIVDKNNKLTSTLK